MTDFDELQKLIVGVKGRAYREGIYTVDGQVVREDVLAIKAREGMTQLQKLNFCSTWYTLKLPKEAVDNQNDQTDSITGCREIEMIFFGLGSRLIELHIGQWAYDELIIYVSNMCK